MANIDIESPGADAADLTAALRALVKAPIIIGASAIGWSHTGDTAEFGLRTVSIPALMGANGILRITTLWSMTSSANNKTPRIRLGGAAGTQFLSPVITTSASYSESRLIRNRGVTNSQVGTRTDSVATAGGTGNPPTTGAIDMSIAQDLVFSGQLANSGETITLESYLVELLVP
jgi:hypothetical protein